MSDTNNIGKVEWCDLTVQDAETVKDFYQKVVGWKTQPVSMGDYQDFNVQLPHNGDTVAGICHARGPNKDIPPQWLLYVRVNDVNQSAQDCLEQGGQVIDGPRSMGESNFCIIQDPAGAVLALVSD